MTEPATTTCDACGTRYAFTSHKDRCPVCCPRQDDKPDDYELDDWGRGDDDDPTRTGEPDNKSFP